jgi:hypothetical protein
MKGLLPEAGAIGKAISPVGKGPIIHRFQEQPGRVPWNQELCGDPAKGSHFLDFLVSICPRIRTL